MIGADRNQGSRKFILGSCLGRKTKQLRGCGWEGESVCETEVSLWEVSGAVGPEHDRSYRHTGFEGV